jgi:IS30 family transposase
MPKKRLDLQSRLQIERMLAEGESVQNIATTIGFTKQTLYKEIKRCKGVYSAKEAQMTLGSEVFKN